MMAMVNERQRIREAEQELTDCKRAYLHKFGWKETSSTPGSYWLWRRNFADLDAKRAAWDEANGAGKPGGPSPYVPYGIITADTDLAVAITERSLDEEPDQDGDPETPIITAEDERREIEA